LQKVISPFEHVKNTIFCVGAFEPQKVFFGLMDVRMINENRYFIT